MTLNTTEPLITTLERHHLRAFRNADSLSFRHRPDEQGEIVLNKCAENSPTGFDQQVILFTGSGVSDYGRDRQHGQRYTGFWLGYGYNEVVRTFIGRLQVGDTISLTWHRDNNTDILRDAGLHQDELLVTITKKGGKKETYLLDSSTCRDNTARTVRLAY